MLQIQIIQSNIYANVNIVSLILGKYSLDLSTVLKILSAGFNS